MAYRPKDSQERITHRLKIAKGHLEKVIRMVENDEYCINILYQMKAVGSGLKETEHLLLENHLMTCVANDIAAGKVEETISEVMTVFRKK